MTTFDVNVLIYAHRADQLHHDFYRKFVETLAASSRRFERHGLRLRVLEP